MDTTTRTPLRATCLRALCWTLTALLAAPPAWAGPTGEQVVNGNVNFQRSGATTTIQASDRSIINYQSFNVGANETVRFVQPGAQARVLNRVLGADPSKIDGSLLANGQVYLLNSAGVFFGPEAVVDVGRLVAAAGSMRDEDFLAGIDRFELAGQVENHGEIRAADEVILLGTGVANSGRIAAQDGVIALVAGSDVYLSEHGSHVLVKVSGPADGGSAPAVANDGLLDAGRGAVRMAAGDVMGLAVRSTGEIRGRDIRLDGGQGQLDVAGRIDASDRSPGGTGGSIDLRGDVVVVADGAVVDASGAAGGGTIRVGGDAHGAGPGRNATLTRVGVGARLLADAETEGDGGEVVVWADGATGVYGKISARGGEAGGDGGWVETSGKAYLDADVPPDVGAPSGGAGVWLLDPANITIVASDGTLDDLGSFSGGLLLYSSAVENSTVGADAIVAAIEAGANVVITTFIDPNSSDPDAAAGAQGFIDVNAPIEVTRDLDASELNLLLGLQAAGDINVNAPIRVVLPADAMPGDTLADVPLVLNVNLIADDPSQSDQNGGDGVGSVTVRNAIGTNGGRLLSQGVDFTLDQTTNPLAAIDAGTGSVELSHNGNVSIDGQVTAEQIRLAAGTDGSGNLVLGAKAPAATALKGAGAIILVAGDDTGGGTGSTVSVDPGVELAMAPIDDPTDPTQKLPVQFTLRQDAALGDGGVPSLAQFTGDQPDLYTLISADGNLTLTDASKLPVKPDAGTGLPTTEILLEGTDVDLSGLTGPIQAEQITLIERSPLTVTQALVDDLAAARLRLRAGSTGTGDLDFAAGVTIGTAAQPLEEIELTAGDGVGGTSGAAQVDAVSQSPTFHVSNRFAIEQDASIDDSDGANPEIPAVAQFASGLPAEYELRSNDGNITIADVAKIGAEITTQAGATDPFDVDAILVTPNDLTLPDPDMAAGEFIDFGDNSFTWGSPGALVVDQEINKVTADTIVLQASTEASAGTSLTFADQGYDPATGTYGSPIQLQAREIRLVAGQGQATSSLTSIGARVTNDFMSVPESVSPTMFLGRYAQGTPETFLVEQDSSLDEGSNAVPAPLQFENGVGPTTRFIARSYTSISAQELTRFPDAPSLVLSAPGTVFLPSTLTQDLDMGLRTNATWVRSDTTLFGEIPGTVPTVIQADILNLGTAPITYSAWDEDLFEDSGLTPAELGSPSSFVFTQQSTISLGDLPPAAAFLDGLDGVAYALHSTQGDIDLTGDLSRVTGSGLDLGVDDAQTILFPASTQLDVAYLQARADGDITVADGFRLFADPTDPDPTDTTAFDERRGQAIFLAGTPTVGAGSGNLVLGDNVRISGSRIDLRAGNGSTSTSFVSALGSNPLAPTTSFDVLTKVDPDGDVTSDFTLQQDADLVDYPQAAQFTNLPDRYTLISGQGRVQIGDPVAAFGPVGNRVQEVVAIAGQVALVRPTGAWDFTPGGADFEQLTLEGLSGPTTSPSSISVSQPDPVAGANLLLPENLGGGIAGVAYSVAATDPTSGVTLDATAASRAAGSALSVQAAAGQAVTLASDLSLTSLSVASPALVSQDVAVTTSSSALFQSTVDTDPGAATSPSLTLNAGSGTVQFERSLGSIRPLGSLTVDTDASGLVTFGANADQVVAVNDISFTPGGLGSVPATATVAKASGDLSLQSQSGSVVFGKAHKATVGGTLAIDAAQRAQLADVVALDLSVDAPQIDVVRRPGAQVLSSGGNLVQDSGVDILANTIQLSTVPVATGVGADPVFGVPNPANAPPQLAGFPVAAIRADFQPLQASGLVAPNGRVLDWRTEGPERTNPATIYSAIQQPIYVAGPPAHPLVSQVAAEQVGIEPRAPTRRELLAAATGVVVYDDVASSRAALRTAALVGPPAEAPTGTGAAAPTEPGASPDVAGSGDEVTPIPVTRPRLEPEAIDRAAALHRDLFGPDGENTDDIRAVLQKAIEDYRRDTGARRVYGFELRRYVRNRPSSQFEAYRTLRDLDLLFRVHRRSGLAPSEYRRIQRGWLEEIQPEGISLEELAETIHPTGRRRSGDILEIFGE